jgi:hypothetical protein
MASKEFQRLFRAPAWEPDHPVANSEALSGITRIDFEDGSRLSIFSSGTAGFFCGNGVQSIVPDWHSVANHRRQRKQRR